MASGTDRLNIKECKAIKELNIMKVYQNMWNVYPASKWAELYLDWVNNFLTVKRFAEHYGMTQEHAEEIIFTGRKTDNFTKNWNQ